MMPSALLQLESSNENRMVGNLIGKYSLSYPSFLITELIVVFYNIA